MLLVVVAVVGVVVTRQQADELLRSCVLHCALRGQASHAALESQSQGQLRSLSPREWNALHMFNRGQQRWW